MTVLLRPPLTAGGLRPVDRALESYPVRVRGSTSVAVLPGDRVTVVDSHGDQPARLTITREQSTGADTVELFGGGSRAGERFDVEIDAPGMVIVDAPGGRIVDGAPPPSELRLEIRRAAPREQPEPDLPDPLAEPRLELRIDRASAEAFEVRAGEWVQVIDVAGQQCSDLLAFGLAKLERGVERGIDPTTTRSLLGRAHPAPGLLRRLYDTDMDPLMEVVQDTVGRHDAFGLACTARYYEDAGYPGHVNCSDNFNAQLGPWRVAPRAGWEALNLFYNTAFDANDLYLLDEPWSRAGDHVLLRASTDLLCASSACPDDIDPANAWECTDIHVRVYPAKERFQMAIAHRPTIDDEPVMTTHSGFGSRTRALTDRFSDVHGTWIPDGFHASGTIAEYTACRERVAVMDLSSLRKWEVLGPGALPLLQRVCTRDVRALAVGQVTYTAICQETGGMIDDATVMRLGEDRFRVVGGDPAGGAWLREHAATIDAKVLVKDASDELHNLAVQGPRSRELLAKIVLSPGGQPDLAELRWFRLMIGRIGGPKGVPVVITRTGYTGELGYEVFCHPSDGPAVWDAVLEAGAEYGLAPIGFQALDLLRIEAGLILAGHEFDDDTDPLEAGIGFAAALGQPEDFIGKAALIERAAHPQRRLVGLLLDGAESVGHGAHVYLGRQRVGVVTSGCQSPYLRRPVALCRVAVQHAEPGTRLEIGLLDGHRKRIGCEVTTIPFYDPQKTRPRA